MQTKVDLSKYESLYDTFDGGHDRRHLNSVRDFSVFLAKRYCPNKIEIAYVAATLHDIGISISREDHERHGYEMILKDMDIKNAYTKEEYMQILESIKEHRASTGNPKCILAKVVSDADKVSDDTNRAIYRAYEYGKKHEPKPTHKEDLLRAAKHLKEKFGSNGHGTRLYFEESMKKLEEIYNPIIKALEENDIDKLNYFLEEGKKYE